MSTSSVRGRIPHDTAATGAAATAVRRSTGARSVPLHGRPAPRLRGAFLARVKVSSWSVSAWISRWAAAWLIRA